MKPDPQVAPPVPGDDAFLRRHLPGVSPAIKRLRANIKRLNANRNLGLVRMILLRGESGAGKTHVAKVLAAHRTWEMMLASENLGEDDGVQRGLAAFTGGYSEIHLPAIPDQLIESELFGHVKGAFTDAKSEKRGRLGGGGESAPTDILLDEIGDASPQLQAKLLRVLEDGRFSPIGSLDELEVSARLILATNRDLKQMVLRREFREDLYWRLQLFVVRVPPMREQPENTEPLATCILQDLAKGRPEKIRGPENATLTQNDKRWAQQYAWPGNVRELKYALTRWLYADGQVPLEEIVTQMRTEDLDRDNVDGSACAAITACVSARLDAARRGEAQPIGTPGELIQEFERHVTRAAGRWYKTCAPSKDDLARMFPQAQILSVRNKLGKWGRE